MISWLRRWLRGRSSAGPAPAPPAPAKPLASVVRSAGSGSHPAAARASSNAEPPAPLEPEDLFGPAVVTPSPPTEAVAAIEQQMRDELTSVAFDLPPFPASSARVLELVEQPDLDLNELVRVLHWEPAVVAHLLAMASTVHYRGAPVDDVRGAVMQLGLREVGAIATAVSARSLFETASREEQGLFPSVWLGVHRETLAVAFTAGWLAQARDVPRHDRVFLRALFGAAGRPVALRALASQILAGKCDLPREELITSALDGVHREARALLFDRWALPHSLTRVLDPCGDAEDAIVDLVASLAELARAPYRREALRIVVARAEQLRLDRGWLKVVVRELRDAGGRVQTLLGSPGTGASPAAKPAPHATGAPSPR